jgi:hypothetical protein
MAREIDQVIRGLDVPGTRTAARKLNVFVAGMEANGLLPRGFSAGTDIRPENGREQLTLFDVKRPVQIELGAKDFARVDPIVQEFLAYDPHAGGAPDTIHHRTVLIPRFAHQFRQVYGGTEALVDDKPFYELPLEQLYWEKVTEQGWGSKELGALRTLQTAFKQEHLGVWGRKELWTVADIREASFTELLKVRDIGDRSAVFLKFAFAKL